MLLFLLFNSQKGHLKRVSPGRLHNEKNNPELLLTHHPSNCKYKKTVHDPCHISTCGYVEKNEYQVILVIMHR